MNNSSSYYDYIYKVLLLGDSSVGKTCFLLRYADDSFSDNYISTIGLDYRLKMINMDNDKIVKMQIWDTAGQDRFRAITKNYYKGAHGILLMYDVTNFNTFANIKNWLIQIKENTTEKVKIILVGNKIDAEDLRKVSYDDGKNLAAEYKLEFFETSAKKKIGVDDAFNFLTKDIYNSATGTDKKTEGVVINKLKSKDNELTNKNKKKCCK